MFSVAPTFLIIGYLLLFCLKMALCVRLCGRGLLGLHNIRSISVTQCCKKVVIQPKAYEAPPVESHDEKNMRLCRPQSPHLTIYKFQLPANLSITHRFTGLALSGCVGGIALTSLLINKPMAEFITFVSTSYPLCFGLFKLGLLFPFTYHFFNGIRHLVWDTGRALSIKGVYVTGYLMLLVSVITAGGLYYYSEIQKQELALRLKREAEEAARLAAEKVKSSAKGKKK